jgi:hypothetical protein
VSQAHSPLLLEPRSAKFFLRFRLLPLVCLSSRPSCASQICLCYARHSGFRMIFLRFDDSMVERVSRRFRFRFKRQPAINDTVKTNNKVPAGLDTRHSPLGGRCFETKNRRRQTRYGETSVPPSTLQAVLCRSQHTHCLTAGQTS